MTYIVEVSDRKTGSFVTSIQIQGQNYGDACRLFRSVLRDHDVTRTVRLRSASGHCLNRY